MHKLHGCWPLHCHARNHANGNETYRYVQGTLHLSAWVPGLKKYVPMMITSVAAFQSSGTRYKLAAVCQYHGEHDIQDLWALTFRNVAPAAAAATLKAQQGGAEGAKTGHKSQHVSQALGDQCAKHAAAITRPPGRQRAASPSNGTSDRQGHSGLMHAATGAHAAHAAAAGSMEYPASEDASDSDHSGSEQEPAAAQCAAASAGKAASASGMPGTSQAKWCVLCKQAPRTTRKGNFARACDACRSRRRTIYEYCRLTAGAVFRADKVDAAIVEKGLYHPFWDSNAWKHQKPRQQAKALLGADCFDNGGVLGPRTPAEIATGKYQPGSRKGFKRARSTERAAAGAGAGAAAAAGGAWPQGAEVAAGAPQATQPGTCTWCKRQSTGPSKNIGQRKRRCTDCHRVFNKMYQSSTKRGDVPWDVQRVNQAAHKADADLVLQLRDLSGVDALKVLLGAIAHQKGDVAAEVGTHADAALPERSSVDTTDQSSV